MRRSRWLLATLLVLAGCGPAAGPAGDKAGAASTQASRGSAPPFASCEAITAPPSAGPAAGAPAGAPRPMPALDLPCFTGGTIVHTDRLRGPAVINLWASWCAPCRAELPILQRYAVRGTGRVTVLGVVTEDERDRAQSLAEDLGVTFPALYDGRGELRRALRRAGLPVTVFVDARGQIRYVYNGEPLDDKTLTTLAREHLGVVVA